MCYAQGKPEKQTNKQKLAYECQICPFRQTWYLGHAVKKQNGRFKFCIFLCVFI